MRRNVRGRYRRQQSFQPQLRPISHRLGSTDTSVGTIGALAVALGLATATCAGLGAPCANADTGNSTASSPGSENPSSSRPANTGAWQTLAVSAVDGGQRSHLSHGLARERFAGDGFLASAYALAGIGGTGKAAFVLSAACCRTVPSGATRFP